MSADFYSVKNQYNTSKLDTNVPLGTNLRHGSLIKKTPSRAPKQIQNGRQKFQNSRKKYSFSQLGPLQLTNVIFKEHKILNTNS